MMTINTIEGSSYTLLDISGTITSENLNRFEECLKTCYQEKKHIIIDLSEIRLIDSSSLGIIILYFSKSLKNERHLILVSLKQDILDIFRITGLSGRMPIFEKLDDALLFINA